MASPILGNPWHTASSVQCWGALALLPEQSGDSPSIQAAAGSLQNSLTACH